MQLLRMLLGRLRKLHPWSIFSCRLGAALMSVFYIVGFVSWLTAPYVPNYFHAVALYRGCMEAAPASLAAGVCAGLLGDMMLRGGKKNGDG